MSFESFDEMATDCVDRDELGPRLEFVSGNYECKVYGAKLNDEIDADQERTERELVECRELESTYCDICGKKCDDQVYIVHTSPWTCLRYCKEHYKSRSDYIKRLELENVELNS